QVVHRPIRAELGVSPAQHSPPGLVGQRPPLQFTIRTMPSAQGPPDRLTRGALTGLGDVKPQPYERLRACRKPLLRAAALAPDPDELIAPIDVRTADTK